MEKDSFSKNKSSNKLPIDEIIEVVFKPLTENEKEIASKYPLPEEDLKILCLKQKLVVEAHNANLLKGIEKHILSKEPELNNSKKLLTKVYKWYKKHPRASKKCYEKVYRNLKENRGNHWREIKLRNLICLGIHPGFLATSYEEHGNFDKAIKVLKKIDKELESYCPISTSATDSDSESELSQTTVINTQDLLGSPNEKYVFNDYELEFFSEEIIEHTPCYDQFNMIGSIVTSTQNAA